jgi:hypothetical protein
MLGQIATTRTTETRTMAALTPEMSSPAPWARAWSLRQLQLRPAHPARPHLTSPAQVAEARLRPYRAPQVLTRSHWRTHQQPTTPSPPGPGLVHLRHQSRQPLLPAHWSAPDRLQYLSSRSSRFRLRFRRSRSYPARRQPLCLRVRMCRVLRRPQAFKFPSSLRLCLCPPRQPQLPGWRLL